MDEGTKRLHMHVHGRVQGVGFRYFVIISVQDLDINGWVRNRYDGTVEVVAEGPKQDLESLLNTVKIGSPSSSVSKVDAEWTDASGEFSSFSVRMDG